MGLPAKSLLVNFLLGLAVAATVTPPPRAEVAASDPVFMTFSAPPDFMGLDPSESADKPSDPFAAGDVAPRQPGSVASKDYPDFFGVGTLFDAAPMLRKAGIEMREGKDLAFFHRPDSRLYVRSTRASAELISQLMMQFHSRPIGRKNPTASPDLIRAAAI